MKYSSPSQNDSLPFLKTALILLLLHPLIVKNTGVKIKSKSKQQKPLRSILLQVIGRCVRRANRAQLKTLPITVPLLLPHLTDSGLFQKIVSDLHLDLIERLSKYPSFTALYNDPLTANLLIVFDAFYLINESFHAISYSGRIDPEAFYHSFPDGFDVCEDYAHWRELSQVPDRHLPFSFCDFPWIFDLGHKGTLLQASNGVKQRHHLQDTFFRAIFDGVQCTSLNLIVRRDRVLQDAREQLLHLADHQLAKQLRVSFSGEEGVDEGGLKKEFFQLCWNELFASSHHWFVELEEASGCFWFNTRTEPGASDIVADYKFIGILLALAIYNGVLVAPRFPLLLFKKLLSWPLLLDDYAEIDSVLVNSINKIDGDCIGADIYHVVPGSEIELIPNGSSTLVTSESLSIYVSNLTRFLLKGSVDWQFDAFRNGFEVISGGSVIYGFRPDELFSLAYGSDDFDISELAQIVIYEGGYQEECPQIRWFWDCLVNKLTSAEQHDFLSFLTGSSRAPLAGLSHLKSFTITKASAGDTDRLPTAHTCFNTLLLPEYCDAHKLEDKLKLAIRHHEGFGLI